MQKYRCYYTNDFRDDYDAMAKQDDDGDWYLVEDVDARIAALEGALRELHAIVRGECPSLLNEDSGGNSRLDLEICALMERCHGT